MALPEHAPAPGPFGRIGGHELGMLTAQRPQDRADPGRDGVVTSLPPLPAFLI